ncbi:Zinc/iron permease [Cordyceps fumosorosea ARSEF 2679]|uniref:Zinc/iron permease n=1 Tax=Cordyceps fumosorosea (strain ARSEF 2679) TaxID=1081104 RepID=A0A162MVV5_CORFA|nr:Zinc/iron permease [Cordyceps fumosorosea ARSEF 2679]OAA71389.1 Zinc/iron permease [Cordyceps fumosorosea ARSEF 2679]
MAGLALLIVLCVIMAVASFFAGALPLSMNLSQSQLRLISSIGVGVLVGTSLIVIIPEGIEAASTAPIAGHDPKTDQLLRRVPRALAIEARSIMAQVASTEILAASDWLNKKAVTDDIVRQAVARANEEQQDPATPPKETPAHSDPGADDHGSHAGGEEAHSDIPTLEIGLSMVLGFILMFLIDRLPRHATDSLQSAPTTQHISMDNLGGDRASSVDDEERGFFLGGLSLREAPRVARSMATTIGLVIHAAADGIAMGASSASSSTKLGFVIFLAIMIHKAPAAFGLTSVLLRQGLSKRAAKAHLLVFSLAAPAGALATYLLVWLLGGGGGKMDESTGHWWTGMLLLFSGGTFLYVAMHAMEENGASGHGHDHGSQQSNSYIETSTNNPAKPAGPALRDTLATTVGMLVPLLTQIGGHHH